MNYKNVKKRNWWLSKGLVTLWVAFFRISTANNNQFINLKTEILCAPNHCRTGSLSTSTSMYPDNMSTHAPKTTPGWGAHFRAPAHEPPADSAAGAGSAAAPRCSSSPSAGRVAHQAELAEMSTPRMLAQTHVFCSGRMSTYGKVPVGTTAAGELVAALPPNPLMAKGYEDIIAFILIPNFVSNFTYETQTTLALPLCDHWWHRQKALSCDLLSKSLDTVPSFLVLPGTE